MRLVCDVYLWVCDVINWHGFLRKSMALNASLNPLYMHLAVEVPVRLVVKGALGAHLSPETPPHRDARAILSSHTCLSHAKLGKLTRTTSHDHTSMPSLPMQPLPHTTGSLHPSGIGSLWPRSRAHPLLQQRLNTHRRNLHGIITRTDHMSHAQWKWNYSQLGHLTVSQVTSMHSSGHANSSSVWSNLGQACRIVTWLIPRMLKSPCA